MRTAFVGLALVLAILIARVDAHADLSTPAAAARSLWTAVSAADAVAVARTLHAENETQRELTAAMAELLVVGERLKRVAHDRFGDAGDAMGRRMIEVDDVAAIEKAKVEEKGDVATVAIEGAAKPLTFRRSAEGWRLVVIGPEGGRSQATAVQVALVRASARAIEAAAEEIRKGQYATADAASAAVEQKLHAVMLDAHRTTATRPATRPAGS